MSFPIEKVVIAASAVLMVAIIAIVAYMVVSPVPAPDLGEPVWTESPIKPFQAGFDPVQSSLALCRAPFNGGTYPGYEWTDADGKKCLVAVSGIPERVAKYKLLEHDRAYTWSSTPNPEALVRSSGYDLRIGPLHACRGPMPGGTYPGVTWENEPRCWIVHGSSAVPVAPFEQLVSS